MSKIKVDRKNVDAEAPKEEDRGIFITVFTDGSHCPKTKAWGVGVWIKGDASAHTDSKGGVGLKDSNEVELEGLNMAAEYILNNMDVTDKVLIFQCDNTNALSNFNHKQFYKHGAKFVKLKHVKGHSGARTKRSWVNNLVDKMAGDAMRKYRGKA
ncbi:RNase H [Vibrio phage vB_ValP_VA-RY-3]|nr:RNase H [Vibrio phage vB_ValP_VA-RY-3]